MSDPRRSRLVLVFACVLALAGGIAVFALKPGAAEPSAGAVGATPAVDGETVPAQIALTDLDGRAYTLGSLRGKLVIVNFWATWCPPCLHEIPLLTRMQQTYGDRGLQFIGPAVDDIEEIRRAAPGLKFNYPLAVGEAEAMLALMSELGNEQGGLPFSVAIGPDGRVLERQLGEYDEAALDALIRANLPR